MKQLVLKTIFLFIFIGTGLTSCYPMPSGEDYSVIPMTNNPDFKGEGASPLTPNAEY